MIEKVYFLVYYSLLITSIMLFSIAFFSSGSVMLNTSITGYVLTIISLLLMMTFSMSSIYKDSLSPLQVIFTLGPFFFLFFLIAWYLYFLITFKNRIFS